MTPAEHTAYRATPLAKAINKWAVEHDKFEALRIKLAASEKRKEVLWQEIAFQEKNDPIGAELRMKLRADAEIRLRSEKIEVPA